VDRDDIGSIARGELRRELVVARPFNRGDTDLDIRIVGVELVDQRGDDAAFADGLADIGVGAEIGVAGAEEALDRQFGGRECRSGDHHRARGHGCKKQFPQVHFSSSY
jgi:hypothetical protein